MLGALESHDNIFKGDVDAAKELGIETKSFRDYYSQLTEHKEKIDLSQLEYPSYHNYSRISLN